MIKKSWISPLELMSKWYLLRLAGCSLTDPRVQGQCCQNGRANSRGVSVPKLLDMKTVEVH